MEKSSYILPFFSATVPNVYKAASFTMLCSLDFARFFTNIKPPISRKYTTASPVGCADKTK